MIQFMFNPRKALQAIEWMLARAAAPVDFHTLLKAVYFADKEMLNTHGRPIFGATYRAMEFGPVPLQVYEMLKCEPIWLSELQQDEYPWAREGYRVKLHSQLNVDPVPEDIAPGEMRLLERAFDMSRGMTFNRRTRETHGMDWVEGTRRPGGRMAYEDMIATERADRAALIEELEAMGPRLVL